MFDPLRYRKRDIESVTVCNAFYTIYHYNSAIISTEPNAICTWFLNTVIAPLTLYTFLLPFHLQPSRRDKLPGFSVIEQDILTLDINTCFLANLICNAAEHHAGKQVLSHA